ncbi:hypothetical protein FXO38_09221 [Capsicum annuum]|nr:hypothetical protein FXO38_09221 [Capsicum annuum]
MLEDALAPHWLYKGFQMGRNGPGLFQPLPSGCWLNVRFLHLVFQRMLEFYKTRKRVQVTRMFSSYPFCGLLHVAITSIERGMWDSLYDKLHTVHQCAVTKGGTENCADSICIEVDSAERDATNLSEKLLACESGITIEDIHSKLSTYLVGDDAALSAASSYHVFLLNKFCKLESWLTEQFSVKHFESLGYGNIWLFLEKNMHLFSHSLGRFFTSDMPEKPPLEPSMLDCQFDLLLSQASQNVYGRTKK